MLHYIYTKKLTLKMTNCNFTQHCINLLRIGQMYNIKTLVKACEQKFAKNLDMENIFDSLEIADQFRADLLKDAAHSFIAENFRSLIRKSKFIEIIKPSANHLFGILLKSNSFGRSTVLKTHFHGKHIC